MKKNHKTASDKKDGVLTVFMFILTVLWAAAVFGADSDIRLNSIGFLPDRDKIASITADCQAFSVRSASGGSEVFSGPVSGPDYQGDVSQNVWTVDFSEVTAQGYFYLEVPGVGRSVTFLIADSLYNFAFYTAVRAMYLWRCGTAVSGIHNGITYSHGACHMEDAYLDYLGGGHVIRDGTGGWHDAGDFNKYIVNAGITVGMMLQAWEHFQTKSKTSRWAFPSPAARCRTSWPR